MKFCSFIFSNCPPTLPNYMHKKFRRVPCCFYSKTLSETGSSFTKCLTFPTSKNKHSSGILSKKMYIFTSDKFLKEVNSTVITLIPKIPNPSNVADFRPIACCNVIYKCITKILANRLKPYLGDLINANQTAFIKGRNIVKMFLLLMNWSRIIKGERPLHVCN